MQKSNLEMGWIKLAEIWAKDSQDIFCVHDEAGF